MAQIPNPVQPTPTRPGPDPSPAPTPAPTPAPAAAPTPTPAVTPAPAAAPALDPTVDWAAVKSYVEFVQAVNDNFPSWAWALDDPELGPVIKQATEEDWTDPRMESALRDTNWWNDRTAAQRSYDVGQNTMGDADIAQAQADAETAVRNEAGQLGVEIDDAKVAEIAKNYLRNGWNAQELTGALLQNGATPKGGDFGASKTAINGIANDYMVKLDQATTSDLAKRLLTGEITDAGITDYIRNIAKQRFPTPQLVEQIDNGVTLRQYFQPHRQAIADALNLDANSVDLTDAKYRPVLGIRDGDTIAPMTLGQVDRFTRTLDEYWKTKNGKAEQATMGRSFLKQMGVIA